MSILRTYITAIHEYNHYIWLKLARHKVQGIKINFPLGYGLISFQVYEDRRSSISLKKVIVYLFDIINLNMGYIGTAIFTFMSVQLLLTGHFTVILIIMLFISLHLILFGLSMYTRLVGILWLAVIVLIYLNMIPNLYVLIFEVIISIELVANMIGLYMTYVKKNYNETQSDIGALAEKTNIPKVIHYWFIAIPVYLLSFLTIYCVITQTIYIEPMLFNIEDITTTIKNMFT